MMKKSKLKILSKVRPLYEGVYDYAVLYGGRSSGKSHAIAQLMIHYLDSEVGVKILCLRHTATSLMDSAYRLISDKIEGCNLSMHYNILPSQGKIIHKYNGGEVVFIGMQDYNSESIKSLEGFKYCWFEEAQVITESLFDVLDPTIRMAGSKIYLTFNPQKRTDFVYEYFILRERKNVLVIKLNYTDNKFLSETMLKKIERVKDEDNEKYKHVYLGEPTATGAYQFIDSKKIEEATNRLPVEMPNEPYIIGVDPAWVGKDKTVIVIRRGYIFKVLECIDRIENMDILGSLILNYCIKYNTDHVFIDRGLGEGVYSYGQSRGRDWKLVTFHSKPLREGDHNNYARRKDQIWGRLRDWLYKGGVIDKDCKYYRTILKELQNIYTKNIDKNIVQLESKDKFRTRAQGKSSDIGDALALTFSEKNLIINNGDNIIGYKKVLNNEEIFKNIF